MLEPVNVTMVVLNLALGFGGAVLIARHMRKALDGRRRRLVLYAALIGAYFVESVAFAAGMGTNVFTIGMAFVWGVVLGMLFRKQEKEPLSILKATFAFSLYTCLPALSLLAVPCLLACCGWSVLSVEGGRNLGVPEFVPWPLNTVLGFSLAVALSPLVFKTAITTGIVSILLHLRKNHRALPVA